MLVRKLSVLDKNKIINNLIKLQGEDRRLRFGAMIADEAIKNYVEKSFDEKSKWFGVDHIDGYLVATCHAAILDGEAELGCCVDEEYRGEGLAQQMFDRSVTWLRTQGITEVFMHCLTENAAMRHIARKNQMTVVSCGGESDAKVEIEPATPATVLEDAYMDRVALYDMYFKNNYRIFDFYWNRQTRT